ncbi:hypothetical protein [Tetragenococcus halophilus]|uniref:hypothetical protein n=1 Tax=Tetragenococcus halophilus TaxID=51669 RepID=UPI00209B6027|nr:hypothetical protein [Tetragenococcus halophilus]MCO8287256.1 hypothetical protein [Tetragenococcus halophilus]
MCLNKEVSLKKRKELEGLTPPDASDNVDKVTEYEGIYLFVSFDLVDSTKYKNIATDWVDLFSKFYDYSKERMSKDVNDSIKVWKFIGDEVLFYLKVNSLVQFQGIAAKVLEVMNNINNQIHKNFPDSKGIIYLKGTMFVAKVSELEQEKGSSDKGHGNYIITTKDSDFNSNEYSVSIKDFLGPDIDLGFRIAKHSHKKQLIVSLELAYLICRSYLDENIETKRFNENFRIFELQELKGILHNRKYPIIWFKNSQTAWEKTKLFEYDDEVQYSTEYQIYQKRYNENKINTYDEMNRILEQSGRKIKVEEILKSFEEGDNKSTPDLVSTNSIVPLSRSTEVHYVLIGITKNDKVAIFKKKTDDTQKKDFGCVHSEGYRPVLELLKEYYEPLFSNMKIKKNEKDLPLPISLYEYENTKKNKKVTGFMFVAEIEDVLDKPNDYLSHDLINLEKIKDDSQFYNNSYQNVKRAKQILRHE